MSASVQPFSKAARGRLPMRPWMRVVLVGVIIVGMVMLMMGVFVLRGSPAPPSGSNAYWSAGAPMTLPAKPDTKVAANDQPSSGPAPADTGLPGPATPQLVQPMRVWGSDSGGYAPPRAPSKAPFGDHPARDEASNASEAEVDKDISLLLPEGVTFGCVPQSPIDTQLVGSVTCTVDEEVLSADGSNRLIDKGAFVTGEIQRGLGLGQDRAFILWHRVRSAHVRATLDGPGVDPLGQMGVPGILDEHLWQKIKATALLTGVEGLGQAGENLANRGNGNSYVNFSNGQSLASQALQHDINIPTTLWRGQAWPLRIRVEHDVWFRRAYNDVLVAGK